MKVYVDDDDGRRLVGCADVPEGAGLVYEVPMFGAASVITDNPFEKAGPGSPKPSYRP